jgi:hypothetical protein
VAVVGACVGWAVVGACVGTVAVGSAGAGVVGAAVVGAVVGFAVVGAVVGFTVVGAAVGCVVVGWAGWAGCRFHKLSPPKMTDSVIMMVVMIMATWAMMPNWTAPLALIRGA